MLLYKKQISNYLKYGFIDKFHYVNYYNINKHNIECFIKECSKTKRIKEIPFLLFELAFIKKEINYNSIYKINIERAIKNRKHSYSSLIESTIKIFSDNEIKKLGLNYFDKINLKEEKLSHAIQIIYNWYIPSINKNIIQKNYKVNEIKYFFDKYLRDKNKIIFEWLNFNYVQDILLTDQLNKKLLLLNLSIHVEYKIKT